MSQPSRRKALPARGAGPAPAVGDLFHWRDFDPAMLANGLESPLARELITFRDHLEEMVRDHLGEFAIIHRDRIVAYRPSRPLAVREAFRLLGGESVLIKQVRQSEPVRHLGGLSD